MLNTDKIKNVLTSYCYKVDVNTFRLNTTVDTSSNNLDKAIMSYIDNGYIIKDLMITKSYSYALMCNSKRFLLLTSIFGKVLDDKIKIIKDSNYIFSILFAWCNSSMFKSCFENLTHFSIASYIPNSLIKILCKKNSKSLFVTITFKTIYDIEIHFEE